MQDDSVSIARSGRKSLTEYEINPSLQLASATAKTGQRLISDKTGKKHLIVDSTTGEDVGRAGFYEVVDTDKTNFVKMYVGIISAIAELTAPGQKLFKIVYLYVLKNPDTDEISLHHKRAGGMAKATFDRGLTELLSKEILYKSTIPNLYFLNINYMFNGDRFRIVKEYRLKEESRSPTDNSDMQGSLNL